ncbi:MAG: zinc ribbon domain-containing protein [Planctomycetota bacterium]|jgi:hypothetical protein
MENCPQCNTQLGEGAKSCAACGWTRSKSKIWIILGSIFGVLALLCCAGMAWIGAKGMKVAEVVQTKGTVVQLKRLKVQVLSWSAKNDGLPDDLTVVMSEAVDVELDQETRDASAKVNVQTAEGNMDMWQTAIQYTKNEDGSFELRSAGADQAFNTEDDFVEAVAASETLAAAKDDLRVHMKELVEAMKAVMEDEFGVEIPDQPSGGSGVTEPEAPDGDGPDDAPVETPAEPEGDK